MTGLETKIEKKKADIEKRKTIITKQENKLSTITDQWDIRWQQDEIKSSQRKLRDLEIQLENLYKQQEKKSKIDNVERVPVIEEFLEAWKIRVIEWYITDYNRIKEYINQRNKKRKQFEAWKQENHIYHYNSKEAQEKEKELGIDYETYKEYMKHQSQFTLILLDKGSNWQAYLKKEIEKDKNNKRALFIARVKEITGKITDVSWLTIGDNGEINGVVTGEKGKAKVETISAGGWNIQCYHFRVLVRELI